jgi:hypothetical protein
VPVACGLVCCGCACVPLALRLHAYISFACCDYRTYYFLLGHANHFASAGGKHLIDPSRGVQIVDEVVLANVLPIVQFYDALSCQPLTHVFAIDHETGLAYVA